MTDRKPNVVGAPVEGEGQEQRPSKAAREQEAADKGLGVGSDEERRDDDGGVGYTEEGKRFDRVDRAEH